MTTTATTATTIRRPLASWQRIAAGSLVALLSIVPFALAASAMMPSALGPVLGQTSDPGPASTGAIPLDMLLSVMVPAGYLVLLFGALRAAGWGRSGSAVALGVAVACSVVIWVVPISPLTDIEMADRMVAHGLINAGVITAGFALLIELTRRRSAEPLATTPIPGKATPTG